MKKLNSLIAILLAGFMTFSCINQIEEYSDSDYLDTEQAYVEKRTILSIRLHARLNSRTIKPGTPVLEKFTNFKLYGKRLGSTILLAEADNISTFPTQIEIQTGKWTFSLQAMFDETEYSASVEYEIKENESNSISFVLAPVENPFGGFSLSLDLSSNSTIDKVNAILTTITGEPIESKTFELTSGENRIILFSKNNLASASERLEPGTYHLLFKFFVGNDPSPINQWENYIQIKASVITTATVSLDFNEVYSISYKNEDGGPITEFDSGIAISKYSRRSDFELPKGKQSGKIFIGWKKSGTDTYISEINPSSEISGNLELIATFANPVLYVSSSGDDETNTGFSSTSPLKTFDKTGGAIDKIIQYGNPDLAWTIKIDGETSGKPRGYSGTNQNYGQIELPAELTSEVAKSILITGATEHSDWLTSAVPNDLDTINRGGNGSANTLSAGDSNGAALVVSTAVPVTITNLKITGGSGYNGGGILINEGATVSIGDGVLINKNRASNKGGAICNLGTLFIYGSAVIGDKDATDYPTISSTQDISSTATANYASSGGGIFNGDPASSTIAGTTLVAKLYLGYKPSETDLSPVEEEFTGGIYCNGGGATGGAICNSRKSEIYMSSGTLSHNAVDEEGGAIYNLDAGIFKMSGGNIHTNRAAKNSGVVRGGGVHNHGATSKFIMSGGSIYNNQAWANAGGTTDAKGGGVFNGGYMFMYGNATIGKVPDDLLTPSPATSSSCSNKANMGGGIYNAGDSGDIFGRLYIGYKPDDTYTIPEATEFTGGIYYNYAEPVYSTDSKNGGGGIYSSANNGYGEFKMSSGTIAYNSTNDCGGGIRGKIVYLNGGSQGINIHDNSAEKFGNAIFIEANNSYYLEMSGSIDIPKGQDDYHDIYMGGTGASYYSHIQISNDLEGNLETIITPETYIANIPLVSLATGSTANLEAEVLCFSITPQTNDGSGTPLTTPVNWKLDTEGKLCLAPTITVTRTDSDTITHNSGRLEFELENIDTSLAYIYLELYSKTSSDAEWELEDADEGHRYSSGNIDGDLSKHFMEITSLSDDIHIYKIKFIDPEDKTLVEYEFSIE